MMLPTAAHAATAAAAAAVPIKDTIVAIYSLLGGLLTKEPIVSEELESLDLTARVRVVAAFLNDLRGVTAYESIELAKQDLADTLEDIKAALERLHSLTKIYSEVFFASWRYGATLQASLQIVVTLSERLKLRLARLIMLLPLKN